MKKFSRGFSMVEALIVSVIGAAGAVFTAALLNSVEETKEISEAQANVDGIAQVMQSSVGAMPRDVESYKQLLRSKWSRPIDPWENYYRIITYQDTQVDPCNMSTTNFHVELPDGRVIRDVLYVVWTRPEKLPETGNSPQGNQTDITNYETPYAQHAGNLKLTRDTVFSLYTLDMYKAKYCFPVASGGASTISSPPPPQNNPPPPPPRRRRRRGCSMGEEVDYGLLGLLLIPTVVLVRRLRRNYELTDSTHNQIAPRP